MDLVDACKTDNFDTIRDILNEKVNPTKECYKILLNNYKNENAKQIFDKDGLPFVTQNYYEEQKHKNNVEIGFCSFEEMETKKQITDIPNINLLIQYGYKIDKQDLIEALECNLHYKNYETIDFIINEDLEKIRISNVYNLIKNHNDLLMFKKIIEKYKITIDYNLLIFCCNNHLKPSIISHIIKVYEIQPTYECLIEICKAKYYQLGYDLINNYNINPTKECLEHASNRNNVDNKNFCNFLKTKIDAKMA
jgi:hypothetical protein